MNTAKYLFFDTETNGVPKNYKAPYTDTDNWPRLLQLGFLLTTEMETRLMSGNILIQPTFDLNPQAAETHGLTIERLQGEGMPIKKAMEIFYHAIDAADVIIAHNLNFDKNVIGAELERLEYNNNTIDKLQVCTMHQSTSILKLPNTWGGFKWPKLQELHAFLFGAEFEDAHDAFADIQATANCYFEMIERNMIAKPRF